MKTIKDTVKTTHSLTNTTDMYLLVGNHDLVISAHDTREQAEAALNKINENNMPWSIVEIAAPGETVSGVMTQAVWVDQPDLTPEEFKNLFLQD